MNIKVKRWEAYKAKPANYHKWASTSILMSAISDIRYSDIGRKYVGLKTVIPISTSEFIPISDVYTVLIITVEIKSTSLDLTGGQITT